jgi:hypothetical protein
MDYRETPGFEEKDSDLLVLDTTAKIRFHDQRDIRKHVPLMQQDVPGQTMQFEPNKPTRMPLDYGMKFLQNGWIVRGLDGKVIKPPPSINRDANLNEVKLEADQVIAQLEELSAQALLKRCKILSGSQHLSLPKSKKADLIGFLLRAQALTDESASDQTGETEEGNQASIDDLTQGMDWDRDDADVTLKRRRPVVDAA